jgi:hypothetical protein
MHIEFLFKQNINCPIQIERKTWGTAYSNPAVKIKTSGTLQKQINF